MMREFLSWLTLPDAQQQQQQMQQQPQVIYSYDPNQMHSVPEQQQSKDKWIDWRTFVLYGRSNSLWFRIFHGKQYIMELEECHQQMMDELAEVRVVGFDRLVERHQELLGEYDDIAKKLSVANAELKYQSKQTEIALGMSTRTQKRNQVLREHGYAEEVKQEQPKEDNKFTSNNGNSGKENQMILAAMDAYGIPKDVIAEELEMKKTSVVTLASTLKKEYITVNNNEGFCIHFSEKYDKAVLNLDDMFSDDWWRDEKGVAHPREQEPDVKEYADYDEDEEQDDFEEPPTLGRGVIVHSIKY